MRDNVAAGSWSGRDRLLERYDDLLVVEHATGALREVDARGRARSRRRRRRRCGSRCGCYAAGPGGVADAVRLLDVRARPGEPGTSVVARSPTLAEQAQVLAGASSLVLMGQASLRLTGRHTALVRFREPHGRVRLVRRARGGRAARDPRPRRHLRPRPRPVRRGPAGPKGYAAVSAVATVRRPERPRLLPLATGNTRVPSFLTQVVEADRKVPHAGSLGLLSLANPFRRDGAAGDAAGGTHPDLLVLVAVAPRGRAAEPPRRRRPPTPDAHRHGA